METLASIQDKAMEILNSDLTSSTELGYGEGVQYTVQLAEG